MATILDLLAALNRGDLPPLPDPAKPVPIPYAPVPNLGPLSNDTTAAFGALNPEPVPPAIATPRGVDESFVSRYAGPAPVAPTFKNPSTLQKIAAVLSGIGAGPEYAAQLREERQRPQREYQRQLEDYNQRRTRGIEIDTRRAENDADRANRAAEMQYEREFNQWVKKTGVRDEQAKAQMRQAFDLEKIRERERVADEKVTAQQKALDERQRRAIENELRTKDGAPPAIAKEISEYNVGMRPGLSSAAEKWRGLQAQKVQAQIARLGRIGAGGSGGISGQTAKLVEEFNTVRGNLISATASGDAKGQKELRKRLDQLVKRLAGRPGVEAGYGAGQWPYVKVNGALQGADSSTPTQQQPAQGQQADPLGIR